MLIEDDLRPSHVRQQRKFVSRRDEQPARFGDGLARHRFVFVQQRVFRVGNGPQNVEAGVQHRLMKPRTALVVDPRELAHDTLRIAAAVDEENALGHLHQENVEGRSFVEQYADGSLAAAIDIFQLGQTFDSKLAAGHLTRIAGDTMRAIHRDSAVGNRPAPPSRDAARTGRPRVRAAGSGGRAW